VAMAHQRREMGPSMRGSGGRGSGGGLSVIGVSTAVGAETAQVFEDLGVEDGRADLVDAGGPLAEVDFAAAVRAEREVLVVETD
jgi:hypothetical protein